MKTLFLPGMSIRNKDWMEDSIVQMPEIEFAPIYWDHWQNPSSEVVDLDWESELTKIKKAWDQSVNILAKSVGTFAAIKLLNQGLHAEKILFCGVPLKSIPEVSQELVSLLSKPNFSSLLFIQNINDPVGSYDELKNVVDQFLSSKTNTNIKIIKTDREDHHYPFTDLFKEFLN